MRYFTRRRVRATMAVAAGATLMMASAALGDTSASRACRGAAGKNLAKLAKTGFKTADKCHKAANKAGGPTGSCNNVATFDAAGKYAAAKTKATTGIDRQCLPGDPVLGNYDSMSVEGAVYPRLDDAIGGNTLLVEGSADLGGDKAKTKCLATLGKSRTSIVAEILKNSTKCQAGLDKTATSFGPLDPSCVGSAPKGTAKATEKIPSACAGLNGSDVGSCDPLPTCVIDASTTVGQLLAGDFYSALTASPVCGNGLVEGTEQCDGSPACNGACEWTYGTCAPALSGNRVVQVKITSPQALAGARVDVSYPIFTTSLPGVGNSSLVRGRVSLLQPGGDIIMNDTDGALITVLTNATNFIPAGTDVPLLDVSFDRCVPLDQNICNRNPNVFGCYAVKRCTCGVSADCAGTSPACTAIVGAPPGQLQCTGGLATRQNCQADADCAPGRTCVADPQGMFQPPTCRPGHFPQTTAHQPPFLVPTEIGTCDGTDLGPPGGCPEQNACYTQAEVIGCTVSNPTDQNGNPVMGVGCSVMITEPPSPTTTTSTSSTTSTTTSTTTVTTTTDTTTTT